MIFVYLSISFSTERLNKRFDDKRRQFTKPEKIRVYYLYPCLLSSLRRHYYTEKNGNLNHSDKWGSLMLFEKKIFERLDFSSINNKLNFTRLFFLMIPFFCKKKLLYTVFIILLCEYFMKTVPCFQRLY